MAAILEHFRCPICFEIPDEKLFQCHSGHTFCGQCSTYIKTCPQCRAYLGSEKQRIRNRTLEQLLDLMEFACPNKHQGCDKLLRRHELQGHLKFCKFEPFYFCKLIGFLDCPYNSITSGECPEEVLDHLHESHPEILESSIPFTSLQGDNNDNLLLLCENLLGRASKLEKSSVSIWTPHLVHITPNLHNQKISLLFLCQISGVTRNAAWISLGISGPTELYTVQFRIGNSGSGHRAKDNHSDSHEALPNPQMTWHAPILRFQDIDKDLETYAVRIPFCVLRTMETQTGSVELGIKLSLKEQINIDKTPPKVPIKELNSFTTKPSLHLQKERHKCDGETPRGEDVVGVEEAPLEEAIFSDVYCNNCGLRPLLDIRYKCLQCIDYDLCKKCMEKRDVHSHHVFARIQDSRQNELLNLKHRVRSQKGKSSYI